MLREAYGRRQEDLLQLDRRGWTPLHEAAAQPNLRILELVFTGRCTWGVNVWWWEQQSSEELCCAASGPGGMQQRTPPGHTPLFLAAERGLVENAAFLLQHGADPDSQNQVLDSPLIVGMPVRLFGCLCRLHLALKSPKSMPPSIHVFCSHSLGPH